MQFDFAKNTSVKTLDDVPENFRCFYDENKETETFDYRKDDPKLQKKAYRKSLDCYIKADAIGWVEKGRESPVWWRMAVMAERFLDDRDTAVRYYTRIIVELPTSANCYRAQLALKRLNAPVPEIKIYERSVPTASAQPG